jgi:hypothetical protein
MIRENSSVPSQLRTYGDVATRAMHRETVLNGGTTVSLETFKVPAHTTGYFVGGAKGWNGEKIEAVIIPESEFSLETLRRAFGKLYADHLTAAQITDSMPVVGGYLGTWTDSGLVYVDASNWTADRSEAVTWALERAELAIWDVQANGSLEMAGLAMELVAAAA